MALPTEKVTISTFHGGMAPDVGEVVGSLPATAENLLNVEIQKAGSIKRRPRAVTITEFDDPNGDVVAINYTTASGGSYAQFAGGAWFHYPAVHKVTTSDIHGIRVWMLGKAWFVDRLTPIFGDFGLLYHDDGLTFVDSFAMTSAGSGNTLDIHAKGRIINDNNHFIFFNRYLEISAATIPINAFGSAITDHGTQTIQIKNAAGTPVTVAAVNGNHFNVGTFFNNRLWLANHADDINTIYISQVIATWPTDAAKMYAEDPANIVATDGGTITIADAGAIRGLVPYMSGVLVLAARGLWLISGPDSVFSATQFAVTKLSSVGVVGEDAWALVDKNIFWVNTSGVFVLGLGPDGQLTEQSVTSGKLSTRIEKISTFHKATSGLIYDARKRQLFWFVNDDTVYGSDAEAKLLYEQERNPTKQFLHCAHAFILDIDLGAWQQWSLPHDLAKYYGVSDYLFFNGAIKDVEEDVFVNGVQVTENGFDVTSQISSDPTERDYLHLILQRELTGTVSKAEYLLCIFADVSGAKDFGTTDINAEILSHPFTFDNLSNKKKLHFLDTAMTRVESGQINSSTGEDTNPGSLLATFGWDWFTPGASTHPKANFTSQLYHPHRWLQSLNNGGDPKKTVVHEKHKIRGRGTAVQVKLTNPDGKDFHLNGWQITVAGSRRR
jgi:hypothetical protein